MSTMVYTIFYFILVFDQKGDDDDPSSSVVVDDNPPTHDNEVEEDSSVEYSGDEDSDDPDKLWCICQQPHNDRYSEILTMTMNIIMGRILSANSNQ